MILSNADICKILEDGLFIIKPTLNNLLLFIYL